MEQAKKKIIRKVKPAAAMPRLERVAAYCRVSSGKDAMLHSLAAQVSYYSERIQRNPEWEYAGVFADFGLTGTKETRPEFQRMLKECREGKIEISRGKWIQTHFCEHGSKPLEIRHFAAVA